MVKDRQMEIRLTDRERTTEDGKEGERRKKRRIKTGLAADGVRNARSLCDDEGQSQPNSTSQTSPRHDCHLLPVYSVTDVSEDRH